MKRTIIFDLCLCMEVPDGDSVLLRDATIGRMLRLEGVEQAIAPREQNATSDAAMLQLRRVLDPDEECHGDEAFSCFASCSAKSNEGSPQLRSKQRVDWTFAIEELQCKRQHGRDLW